ncbi:MAG: HAMP domain-containing sensor histidine kinase [Phycisphaeraceae bacterium]
MLRLKSEEAEPLRPTASLRWRMLIWALALVILPMALGGYWLNQIAHEALIDRHRETVQQFGQVVAGALAGQIDEGWSPLASRAVRLLSLDQRVAFVLVQDGAGERVHQRVMDPTAWALYEAALARQPGEACIPLEGLALDADRSVVVRRLGIWDPPMPDHPSAATSGRTYQGQVVLAMRDPTMAAALDRLRAAQLGAMGLIVLIALPAVFVAVRRWTGPLRDLVAATRDLAARRSPAPVAVTTNDEVGLLARQFNEMARTLAATYRQLEQANEQLEQKVRDRTAELRHVNDRLNTEIEDKNAFLQAVSHDLVAPVRNIVGLAGMMLRKHGTRLDDDGRTKLDRIAANARQQTEMIDDLLELSRLRTRPGRREPIDLDRFVRELAGSLQYDLEKADVELVIESPLPTVLADRNRVRQVFQNLLENAVKYMLDAEPRRVTVRCVAQADAYQFSVADTGSGIEAEDAARVFQPFQRGRQREAGAVSGRGVGLASVKSIVESWGGRIWVESEPGRGSTFHFTAAYGQVGLTAGEATSAA